ncbi:hypothetical protein QUF50_04235 [Thiotrichales bacterium HSG1]|nr:hypothetical protein [Thiotrichales bacterium HSG1]
MNTTILKEGKKYTFSDYFNMNNPTEEIVGAFGYSYALQVINLPKSDVYNKETLENLKATYYTILPKITLTSEIAKREFLIAPILLELLKATESKINVEYPIDLDDKLSGFIDYLIRSKQDLIVIEAKKGDLDKGFNQLSVEMIALDKYEDCDLPAFYGVITVGDIWKFAILQRKEKHIIKDIHSYRIPEDIEDVFAILKGIVELRS